MTPAEVIDMRDKLASVAAIHEPKEVFGPVDPGFPPTTWAWHKTGEKCSECHQEWPCRTIKTVSEVRGNGDS